MGDANEDLAWAATLPEGDVIKILLEQHARIRELLSMFPSATGAQKEQLFDELRSLVAVHEVAEELVLRPMAKRVVGDPEIEARNDEEQAANVMMARLEELDVMSAEFDSELRSFEQALDVHAEHEEQQEFPLILSQLDDDTRQKMGTRLLKAEKVAPTHAHPGIAGSTGKQATAGPFAAMVDRVKDAFSR